jgi:hypothetical protein
MAIQAMTVVWQDANGSFTLRSLKTLAGAAAIATALQGKSNAAVVETWEGTDTFTGAIAGAGSYLSAGQVAYLEFTDIANNVTTVALPAPDSAIFQADGVSVDATQIAGIIAACIGALTTAAGNAVTAFKAGRLGTGRLT